MNPMNPNLAGNSPRSIQAQIDLAQTSPTPCEACGKEAFQEAYILRKVSALLTGTGKEGFMPIQVFACFSCGHVNQDFLPKELRTPKIAV